MQVPVVMMATPTMMPTTVILDIVWTTAMIVRHTDLHNTSSFFLLPRLPLLWHCDYCSTSAMLTGT